MTDLTWVHTDDLLGELKKRYDVMIFAGSVRISEPRHPSPPLPNYRYRTRLVWEGDVLACQGMASELIRGVQDSIRRVGDPEA